MRERPHFTGDTKRQKELAREGRRRAKSERLTEHRTAKVPGQGAPLEQWPSAFPDAPEDAAGIGRTLSRGL